MKVPDVRRDLVPDTWTTDGEGMLSELGPMGLCPHDNSSSHDHNRLEHQHNQQIPLLEMFAADPWRKYTARYAPCHSSHVQCRVPLDSEWTAGHDVPYRLTTCYHSSYFLSSSTTTHSNSIIKIHNISQLQSIKL